MKNIEEIAKNYYKEFKKYKLAFPKGHHALRTVYLYEKLNNIVVGFLLRRNEKDGENNAILDSVYIFDNQKNVYSFDGKNFKEKIEPSSILYLPVFNSIYEKEFIQSFRKLFGHIVFLEASSPIYFDSAEMIIKFYKFKELKKTTGKRQNKIDELTSHSLKSYSIKDFTAKANFSLYGAWYVGAKSSCKLEMINDNTFVIRMFILCKRPYEVFRIYVEGDKVYKCRKTNIGYWVSATNLSNDYYNFNFDIKDITDEFKNTKLWYMKDIFCDINLPTIKLVLSFLEDSTLEQLYRFGFNNIFKRLSYNITNKGYKDFILFLFGFYNPKGKNVFQKVGLNNYQLREFQKMLDGLSTLYCDDLNIIHCIRILFGEDISDIDNNSFDRILNFLKATRSFDLRYSVFHIENVIKELKYMNKSNVFILNILEKFVNKNVHRGYFTFYKDYVTMLNQLEKDNITKDELDWDTIDEIRVKHDYVLDLLNSKKNKDNVQKFVERKDVWKKWKFENEKFVISYPEDTSDIANEGLCLRHCVKSYIPSVLDGRTNILFLRKKENIDVPYFTIEIDNNGNLRQVHGFCNSNIKKNSEEYAFLIEWVKVNEFNIKDINRVLACG